MKAIVLVISCLAGLCACQNDNMDMMGIINMLYIKADQNADGKITPAEMANIYQFMDQNHDGVISRTEFTTLWAVLTGYDQELSTAYFFLSDLNGDGSIDRSDNSNIFARFDLNGNGVVESLEFMQKYSQVYHEVPFVLLFERVERSNQNDQHLSRTEFSQLFKSLTTSADGSVRKSDFVKVWTDSKFGSQQDAEKVFQSFDTNKDNVVTTSEVSSRFDALDLNGNKTIEILEAVTLGQ
ncbi:calcium-binding protein LPS1-alpha-like isoform X2 [Biomphalaria pfeifferi]|uniref:Calcium-binding protein LPS1-alpha-like isoform X2 n=1 Tax=Biomphalaria pfeifferi TaxID=112525 RepID=A0AAD8C405_BIOPF|nr:calcium-binding protein LPS1-alpha-like isoform X2 [Biomphalaria pfeifferi]